MSRVVLRLLVLLHALGINPAIVAGLILTPPVVAVGYLTDAGQPDDVVIPGAGLRGSFDAFADDAAPRATVRRVDGSRRLNRL